MYKPVMQTGQEQEQKTQTKSQLPEMSTIPPPPQRRMFQETRSNKFQRKHDIDDVTLEMVDVEKGYENGWTETVQIAFEKYRLICQEKQNLHYKAQIYFAAWYRWTTYPILILASAISILASFNATEVSSLDQSTKTEIIMSIVLAILTGLHTLGLAFLNFVEYGQRSSKHNLANVRYASVERYINSQILMKPAERESAKFDFEIVSREFDAIQTNEPPIPERLDKKQQTNK